ncbi:MAG TPA: hypothetical protein VD814_04865 [Nocardioides sp.]|nr:hypothetical protein [Nocardioides sp.]
MALLGSGAAAVTASPAQSAPPGADCASAFPVDAITDGMVVDGLTVTDGTEPEGFTGEVLGVLRDGIAPGVDMVIADLESPEIDRVGIWQGMSGSPVYTAGGELIGAVAYGLAWGPSSVAGITPYEKMDDYLSTAGETGPVAVDPRTARTIATQTDVTARQAAQGMSRLRVPLTISGVTRARLRQLRSERDYVTRQGRAGTLVGTAAASAADPASVKDGGNLGAAMSYGTITAGGVGTVTDRCGDEVVGFGHPMMFAGATTLGLMPAEAVYIQEDSLGAGFKVANLGTPAGTISQDRLTGITGAMGAGPDEVRVASSVTYGNRAEEGVSHSLAEDWHADVTAMQLLALHDVTIDGIQGGSEEAGVLITGTSDGAPFTVTSRDRYMSGDDIAYSSVWATADLVWLLSRMKGVELDSITTDAVVSDSTEAWRIAGVQRRQRGQWVDLRRRQPTLATPGSVLRLRTRLVNGDTEKWVRSSVDVPRRRSGFGQLTVSGGSRFWNDALSGARTVAEVQEVVAEDPRNDQVVTAVVMETRHDVATTHSVSESQDLVVNGRRDFLLGTR